MSDLVDIPCVVLAGGKSRRFGSPKGLIEFKGRPLIAHVISNMTAQTRAPVVVNADPDGSYAHFGETIFQEPEYRNVGPLAGILTALTCGLPYRTGPTALLESAVFT